MYVCIQSLGPVPASMRIYVCDFMIRGTGKGKWDNVYERASTRGVGHDCQIFVFLSGVGGWVRAGEFGM